MKQFLLILVLILAGWQTYQRVAHRPVRLGPGIKAPADPTQMKSSANAEKIKYKDFTITPLAEYDITAKVLSIKSYRMDGGAELSPLDVALGWGRMSDEAILKEIRIRQRSRFYFWRTESNPPIPLSEISTHSANCHLIPASTKVKRDLKSVRKGEIVQIRGKLVRADKENWSWKSSLTRSDTGSGACELIWVETVKTHTR